MKYLSIRIALLLLAIIIAYYISNYIQDHAQVAAGDYNFEGVIAFFSFLSAIISISLGLFTYEAYRFHKRYKIKERNLSLGLIVAIILVTLIFSGYFVEFIF